ncbi:hypothetical protein AVEN_7296-1 [Araneus ventricosus]|uniref:Uncharacterized protein n=1 Tax=Araneus ventricosus TaxID=182803 RepID=A0A4Y2TYK4_ARAVE|nr:hypothetical protein AVEN_7296-1 [Araneus ventricosus]
MCSYFYGQQVVESSFQYRGKEILSSKASTSHSPCLTAKSETSPIPDEKLYSSVLKKEVFINSVYRKVPDQMLCLSKKDSTYLYIYDEFPALPSINSFPSNPIRDLSYSSKNLVCSLLPLSYPTNWSEERKNNRKYFALLQSN